MVQLFNFNKSNSLFSYIVWISASLTIALSLLVPGGYSIGAFFILLLSFSLPFLKTSYTLSVLDKYFIAPFMLYGMGMFFLVYIDDFNIRWLDKPARFMIVILPLIFLLKVKFQKKPLILSCLIGAFGPFGVALIERFFFEIPRAGGDLNPIMFGGISILISLICLNFGLYFHKMGERRLCFFSFSAFSAGFLASLLSGSKGSWIALPIAIFFLLWNYKKVLTRRFYLNALLGSFLLVLTISFTSLLGVSERIEIFVSDVKLYLKDSNNETSVSHRTELWKASIYMFHDSPLVGIGRSEQFKFKEGLVNKNISHKSVLKFSHAHNEYLNVLGLHGIVGLFLLLAVYLVPLSLFILKIKQYSDNFNIKVFAIAGALVPICYMSFALTQALFGHNSGVMIYVFLNVIFWAATGWAEREERVLGNIT